MHNRDLSTSGILLYGPPGTGKSLLVERIVKMLGSWESKSFNCYDLVGKSASATSDLIRSLFVDAEKEYQTRGPKSRLHVIVFDHLDAVPRQHGSTNKEGEGTILSQILSKVSSVTYRPHDILSYL